VRPDSGPRRSASGESPEVVGGGRLPRGSDSAEVLGSRVHPAAKPHRAFASVPPTRARPDRPHRRLLPGPVDGAGGRRAPMRGQLRSVSRYTARRFDCPRSKLSVYGPRTEAVDREEKPSESRSVFSNSRPPLPAAVHGLHDGDSPLAAKRNQGTSVTCVNLAGDCRAPGGMAMEGRAAFAHWTAAIGSHDHPVGSRSCVVVDGRKKRAILRLRVLLRTATGGRRTTRWSGRTAPRLDWRRRSPLISGVLHTYRRSHRVSRERSARRRTRPLVASRPRAALAAMTAREAVNVVVARAWRRQRGVRKYR
jgi:hypothetical protein